MTYVKKLLMPAMIAAMLSACEPTDEPVNEVPPETWQTNSVRHTAVNNAIIAQHTLYDYHFVSGAEALNPLGEHDLGVLAEHFVRYPGKLNIRRGGVDDDVYEARKLTVMKFLAAAGVNTERIKLSEGLLGGESMPSQDVLNILQPKRPGEQAADAAPGTGMGDKSKRSTQMSGGPNR